MVCIRALDHCNELLKVWCNFLNATFGVDWVEANHRANARLPHIKRQKLPSTITAEDKGVLDRVRATFPVAKSFLC